MAGKAHTYIEDGTGHCRECTKTKKHSSHVFLVSSPVFHDGYNVWPDKQRAFDPHPGRENDDSQIDD